jgi:CheY-like chemotaxis protein
MSQTDSCALRVRRQWGDFWVATDDGYLDLFDRDSGEVIQRFLNPSALITACVLTAMLHQLGHKVDTVADGSVAISTYSEALSSGKKDDIVTLDLTIPGGMGGGEVIKLLHQLDPGKNCGFQRILQRSTSVRLSQPRIY